MANAVGNNGGRFYSFAGQPVLVNCNFIVDSTNGNGLGIRSLKGQGVRDVYMATSASFTGTLNSTINVTGISGGTSSLQVGMPVTGSNIPSGTTIASIVSSSAITLSVAATGSGSETINYVGVGNKLTNTNVASTSKGLAWIHLKSNYNAYLGGFSGFVSPPSTGGGTVKIDATDAALTVGSPYVIASVGHGPAGTVTIAPVADVTGSLASTYFTLYDSYGNTFVIWFYVTGVGGSQPQLGPSAPLGSPGLQYVQQTIAENASASTIGTDLASTIALLPSGITGTYSFTATGTTTVTVVSTTNLPVAGIPMDGTGTIPSQGPAVPIFFTITSGSATSGSVWTDGLGHLYTVSATISSQTLLKTTGVGAPGTNLAGTLTFVSGSGSTTALTFSNAVTGFATGFTFAQTVSDTNLQDWQGVGLPAGLIPTVNQSFIATATGSGGSTGTVYPAGVSGITSIEVIGDANQSIAPQPYGPSPHVGGWILVQFLAATSSSVTSLVATAPANNSVVGMSFYVDAKFSPSNTLY